MLRLIAFSLVLFFHSAAFAQLPPAQAILQSTDLPAMLARLRAEAKPENTYHERLLKVVNDARAIDMAHLNLLVDACYFSQAYTAQLEKQLAELEEKRKDKEAEAVAKVLRQARALGSYTNQIIAAGFPKAVDVNGTNGIELLRKVFANYHSGSAFQAFLARVPAATQEQRLFMMDFAVSKNADAVGGSLALAWFTNNPDHSVKAAEALSPRLKDSGRDVLVDGVIAQAEKLSVEEVISLSRAAYYHATATVLNGASKVPNISVKQIVELSAAVSDSNKDTLLGTQMQRIPAYTTSEILELARAAYYHSTQITIGNFSRLKDFTVENAIRIAGAAPKPSHFCMFAASIGQHGFHA